MGVVLSVPQEYRCLLYTASAGTTPIFLLAPSCFKTILCKFLLSSVHPSTHPSTHLLIPPSLPFLVPPSSQVPDFPLRRRAQKGPQGGALGPLSFHFFFSFPTSFCFLPLKELCKVCHLTCTMSYPFWCLVLVNHLRSECNYRVVFMVVTIAIITS